MKTPLEILTDAKKLLTVDGYWIQNHGSDGQGGHCLTDAISYAAVDTFEGDDAHYSALMYAMSKVFEILRTVTNAFSLPGWNDMLGRTKEEVIDALDSAIQLEEAKA